MRERSAYLRAIQGGSQAEATRIGPASRFHISRDVVSASVGAAALSPAPAADPLGDAAGTGT
jgi:hypothetical protein